MKFYVRLGNQTNSDYVKETKNSGIAHIPDIADAKVFSSTSEAKKWISERITAQWVSSYVVMSEEQIRNQQAAAALGSIKSPKKSASSRENGKKGGRPKYATTLHSDGTVTYWSVYRQAWVRRVDIGSIPDAELASMSSTERDKILSRR